MRRLATSLCLLLLFAVSASAQTRTSIATDNFNRGSIGSNWTQLNSVNGTMTTVNTDDVMGSATSGGNGGQAAVWGGSGTFTDDQYGTIVIATLPNVADGYSMGPTCRSSTDTGSNRDYYYVYVVAAGSGPNYTTTFGKIVNGTNTTFDSTARAWSVGDRIEIECNGSTIRALKTGTAFFTQSSETSLTTGKPGILGSGGTGTTYGDDWEGGNLTTAAANEFFSRRRR